MKFNQNVLALLCVLLVSHVAANCRKRRELDAPNLRQLLGSEVVSMQRVRRPLGNNRESYGPISHSGVVVQTSQPVGGTDRWLVHKGKDFGNHGQTVVTRADGMSSRWSNEGTPQSGGGRSVSDLVRSGGRRYDVVFNNCHHAATRMMSSGRSRLRDFGRRVRTRVRNWFGRN